MVNPINPVFVADIKERENKTAPRNADAGGSLQIEGRTESANGEIASQAVSVTISMANMEAAEFAPLNQEKADEMLQETANLIRENPEMAEFAQASIPSQIVLSLLEAG